MRACRGGRDGNWGVDGYIVGSGVLEGQVCRIRQWPGINMFGPVFWGRDVLAVRQCGNIPDVSMGLQLRREESELGGEGSVASRIPVSVLC